MVTEGTLSRKWSLTQGTLVERISQDHIVIVLNRSGHCFCFVINLPCILPNYCTTKPLKAGFKVALLPGMYMLFETLKVCSNEYRYRYTS